MTSTAAFEMAIYSPARLLEINATVAPALAEQ
jgi:hypothetical protein